MWAIAKLQPKNSYVFNLDIIGDTLIKNEKYLLQTTAFLLAINIIHFKKILYLLWM